MPPKKKFRQTSLNSFFESDFALDEREIVNEAINAEPSASDTGTSSITSRDTSVSTGSGRKYQSQWKEQFPWHNYDSQKDIATCGVCSWSINNNKAPPSAKAALEGQSSVWILGFNSWHRGKDAFKKHSESRHHMDCLRIKRGFESGINVLHCLDAAAKLRVNNNAKVLRAIFDTVILCGRQSLPLRGHNDENSNIYQLMNLLSNHACYVNDWMKNKNKFKWLSHDIQNEILELASHEVLRQIILDIQNSGSGYFSIIADETTDISTKEQLSICVRYVDMKWNVKEVFLGLFETPKCDAEMLAKAIQDCLLALGLTMNKCCGQTYDGAANMKGHINGVQTRIKRVAPKATFVYCMGHQMNLIVQDSEANFSAGADALNTLNAVSKFVTNSDKRLESFKTFQSVCVGEKNDSLPSPRPLCPTRWVLRKASVDSFLANYEKLLNWLETYSEDPQQDSSSRATTHSYLIQLEKFSTYFNLRLLQRLLGNFHAVHVAIQSSTMSLFSARQLFKSLSSLLTKDGSSTDNAQQFYSRVCEKALAIKIDLPSIPRITDAPNSKAYNNFKHKFPNCC